MEDDIEYCRTALRQSMILTPGRSRHASDESDTPKARPDEMHGGRHEDRALVQLHLLPNATGQPRDGRHSKTENGRSIALCCDDWFGPLRLAKSINQIEAVRRELIKRAFATSLDNRSSLRPLKFSGRCASKYPTTFRALRSSRNSRTSSDSFSSRFIRSAIMRFEVLLLSLSLAERLR